MKAIKSFLLILFICYPAYALAANSRYAIIIDAGSSGSRLHLFQYDTVRPIPHIEEIFSAATKPGVSAYTTQPGLVGPSLKSLLDDALTKLTASHINPQTVPISILATAGMRIVNERDQQRIYQQLKGYINKYYPFPIKRIETISGKLEGIYAWLDVNYLLGNLQVGNTTVGIIDMGGASTQIAFATEDMAKPLDEMDFALGNKRYRVFSKSFLGLGQDQARAAIDTSSLGSACYPIGTHFSSGTGSFQFASCQALYGKIIQPFHVQSELLSLKQQQFYAFSGVYYGYHFFAVDQLPDRALVESNIANTCMQPFDKLKSLYPEESLKYLSNYCANVTYIDTLLYLNYQLLGSQLTVAHAINQHEIDWTLGAMLYNLLMYQ